MAARVAGRCRRPCTSCDSAAALPDLDLAVLIGVGPLAAGLRGTAAPPPSPHAHSPDVPAQILACAAHGRRQNRALKSVVHAGHAQQRHGHQLPLPRSPPSAAAGTAPDYLAKCGTTDRRRACPRWNAATRCTGAMATRRLGVAGAAARGAHLASAHPLRRRLGPPARRPIRLCRGLPGAPPAAPAARGMVHGGR